MVYSGVVRQNALLKSGSEGRSVASHKVKEGDILVGVHKGKPTMQAGSEVIQAG
jgi:hypothetical protein